MGGFLPKIFYFHFYLLYILFYDILDSIVLIHDLKKSVLGLERYYRY